MDARFGPGSLVVALMLLSTIFLGGINPNRAQQVLAVTTVTSTSMSTTTTWTSAWTTWTSISTSWANTTFLTQTSTTQISTITTPTTTSSTNLVATTTSMPAVTVTTKSTSTFTVFTTALGYLRVVANPAVLSTIYVNNVAMDDWGLNWVKLSSGTYVVHFSDVPGYATPPDQTVTVTAGATTTVTGNFTQLGYLHVVTNPAVAGTLGIDGVVRDDWGAWFPLTPGTHTVHFGNVAGYTAPADEQVTVVAGSTVTTIGNYSTGTGPPPSGFGLLRVSTNPAVVSTIYVNNVAMDDWGLNWVKLAPGTYTIHFADVPGFAAPPNQTVTVTADATTTVTGTFTQLGYLHVVTSPAVAGTISIDGVARDDWGVWVPLEPGQHTVHFGDVAGYTTPSDQNLTAVEGTTVTVTGIYT